MGQYKPIVFSVSYASLRTLSIEMIGAGYAYAALYHFAVIPVRRQI